jgi:hypothetical protein
MENSLIGLWGFKDTTKLTSLGIISSKLDCLQEIKDRIEDEILNNNTSLIDALNLINNRTLPETNSS